MRSGRVSIAQRRQPRRGGGASSAAGVLGSVLLSPVSTRFLVARYI
jgi:hypothetical protein